MPIFVTISTSTENAIDVNEKIKGSLSAYGPPIVQGAISTILAVIPMFVLPSYILQSFTKMVTLVIGVGAFHGLIVLPAIMAFWADCSDFIGKCFNDP